MSLIKLNICDGSSITQMAKLHQLHLQVFTRTNIRLITTTHGNSTCMFALFISSYRYFWLQFSGCHLTSAKMTCYRTYNLIWHIKSKTNVCSPLWLSHVYSFSNLQNFFFFFLRSICCHIPFILETKSCGLNVKLFCLSMPSSDRMILQDQYYIIIYYIINNIFYS